MMALRKFSQAAQRFPEALQYSKPWKCTELENKVQVNMCDGFDLYSSLSILSDVGTRHGIDSNSYMNSLCASVNHPGLQYTISHDHTVVNLTMLRPEVTQVLSALMAFVEKNPQPHADPAKNLDESLTGILFASCFPRKTETPQPPQLFCGENIVLSGKGLSDSEISIFSKLPQGIKAYLLPSEYGPSMQIIETPSEEVELCIAYQAPPLSQSDYHVFKFLEGFMQFTSYPYIDHSRQYNYLYSLLGSIPGVISHEVAYHAGRSSGLFVHKVKSHPLAVTFAGSAIIKSMERAAKQMIPKEMERTQKAIYSEMLRSRSGFEECQAKGYENRSGRTRRDFAEFVLNCSEDFICNRLTSWISAKIPSIIIKGKVISDNAIESMFKSQSL